MQQQIPKFAEGQSVIYQGQEYQIETGIQHRTDYDPPGYFYDLKHPAFKRIPESELSSTD